MAITDHPWHQAIVNQLLGAPCEQQADGTWVCRFGPDGYGATFAAAKIDALSRAVAMLTESVRRSLGS